MAALRRIAIRSEVWPELTSRPHFDVELAYEGCRVNYDEIYFTAEKEIAGQLRDMRRSRKGKVILDGGFQFVLTVEMQLTGGVKLCFRTESGIEFPGKRILEGFFEVEGEYADELLRGLLNLIDEGRDFVLEAS
ncbi:hypothetical protein [Thiolapillus sp.]